jgi:optic atrophy 3 protein
VYHRFDVILRMRVMGLGSPDKVPPLTESAAIDLGGDLLSEFLVFGTGVAILLLEWYRQSSNAAAKDTSMENKVNNLIKGQEDILKTLEKTEQTNKQLEKNLADQNKKTLNILERLKKAEDKLSIKSNIKSTQTSLTDRIGKIIYPTNAIVKASSDCTNSIVYQCAEMAVNQIRFFGK